jgi:hypothetical protein
MRDAVVRHDPAHEAVPSCVGDKTLPKTLHTVVVGPRGRGPETGRGLYPRFGLAFVVWGRTNFLAIVAYPARVRGRPLTFSSSSRCTSLTRIVTTWGPGEVWPVAPAAIASRTSVSAASLAPLRPGRHARGSRTRKPSRLVCSTRLTRMPTSRKKWTIVE